MRSLEIPASNFNYKRFLRMVYIFYKVITEKNDPLSMISIFTPQISNSTKRLRHRSIHRWFSYRIWSDGSLPNSMKWLSCSRFKYGCSLHKYNSICIFIHKEMTVVSQILLDRYILRYSYRAATSFGHHAVSSYLLSLL